ncbi:hypothetical protein J3Q64DRAFT_1701691 [Phycomyces blakesleeanus]|uniref:Uncharacterized protein n=2 Tax=Phycomyces blakesleeanus TaxID=4837 RepID=A0A167KE02_PHYB8|nr:hypothetical protein PHYBLDRAFT_173781 [Phycomyces blakesleeanus NRRL 1555(-)]OAD67869.1 hypothetical protein PHYBLDRAFT_173781 [Phycomyces blakesleeanus NRRL 1555(-)]|eukprot:XP_018285909.1 hypothetical protein PHYBLDRAFT_173781 [Phycomyces blakesleeanus NRRL 1555(-)]
MFAIMVSLSISRLIISADSHCIIWYILCQCIAHFTRPVTIVVALAVHEILKRPIVKIVISLPFYLKMTVSFALPQFVVPIHLALITSLNIVSPNVQNAKPAYIGDIIKQSRSKLTTPYIIFNKQYTKRVCHCPNILLQKRMNMPRIISSLDSGPKVTSPKLSAFVVKCQYTESLNFLKDSILLVLWINSFPQLYL